MKMETSNSSFFEKINKMNRTPSKINHKNKKRKQNNQYGKENITTDLTEAKLVTRKYYNQLYANKFDHLDKMNNFFLYF